LNYKQDCFLVVCWFDPCWACTYGHSTIWLNRNAAAFPALSRFNQQSVVAHELGHTLGLAHAAFYAGETVGRYSVMEFCCFAYNTPQTHDVTDYRTLYP
jgi:hypothetical protein